MAHIPSVDKEVLLRVFIRCLRLTDKTANRNNLRVCSDIYKLRSIGFITFAKNSLNTLFLRANRQFQQYLVIADKSKLYMRINEYNMIELVQ